MSSMAGTGSSKKVRKPYTITKSRENWSDDEHDKFLEALHMFGRDWKKIEDYVGSKTVIQIRSHAQKYFLKIQKKGAHVPPPRPKRKTAHSYQFKAGKNVQASLVHPLTMGSTDAGRSQCANSSMLMNVASNGNMSFEDESTYHHPFEDDNALEGVMSLSTGSFSGSASSSLTLPISGMPKQGVPDFAEVYNFIGSVFDPDKKGHLQKLREMDAISSKTALILMRNLTINLSSSRHQSVGKGLTIFDVNHKIGGAGVVTANHRN